MSKRIEDGMLVRPGRDWETADERDENARANEKVQKKHKIADVEMLAGKWQ